MQAEEIDRDQQGPTDGSLIEEAFLLARFHLFALSLTFNGDFEFPLL